MVLLVFFAGMMFGDDPHFSVVLRGRKLLCFSVMGQHHLSYNLISNPNLLMNAIFAPDSRREEVTWIGTVGIIAKNSTTGHIQTKLKFEALPQRISIIDKATLYPKNIEKIVIKNGKVLISESKPTVGFKYPSVVVILEDSGLKFTIKFMSEHLDMFWHKTAQEHSNSHGLIGKQQHNSETECFMEPARGRVAIYIVHKTRGFLMLHIIIIIMCFISRRPLTYRVITNNITQKELYDFYYTLLTLTTGYKDLRIYFIYN